MIVYEYEVQGNFGYGWEYVLTADDKAHARELLDNYRSNDYPNVYRVRKVKAEA